MAVRYRVAVAGGDDRFEGANDADVTLTVPIDIAAADGFDASIEYMRGRLKVTGATSSIFEVLANGEATTVLGRLARAD